MSRSFFKPEEPDPVDDLIGTVLEEMDDVGPTDEKYPALMTQLERLTALKADTKPKAISRDTVLMVAGNIFGILIIVLAERSHVISTKALTQLHRPLK